MNGNRSTTRIRIIAALSIGWVVVIVAIAAAAISRKPKAPHQPPATPASIPSAVVGSDGNKQTFTVMPIMLKQDGFVPDQITKPAGEFILSVGNDSRLPDVTFQLDPEHGNRLHQSTPQRQRTRWRQQVRLNPGTYFLTAQNHPRWICRITITAQ